MRLSAYPGHPDYKPEWLPCYVLLNGEVLTGVTHADDERGQVAVCALDRRGNSIVEGGQIVTKILTGKVEFRRDWNHVEAIGIDNWMRDRIETAHRDFMKRTA